jgi:SAM-dependent methyltransferase
MQSNIPSMWSEIRMLKYRIRILIALAVVALVPSQSWPQDSIPFVPSPMLVVERMLQLAEVRKDDVLYDLGSGDGRIVIEAAKKFGVRGVGVDLNPTLVEQARRRAAEEGVSHLVQQSNSSEAAALKTGLTRRGARFRYRRLETDED